MRSKVRGGELGGKTNLAVLAPIKPGFIEGFETMTYVERLHRLLDAFNEARQNLREATLFKPPFPDSVGRFGIIQSFRYVIVPPEKSGGVYRLSLNVTFDGGWEPYMRVIYRDIGFLLDALFCHSDGYPGSQTSSFDTYCRWVRSNELMSGLFYDDSNTTIGDAHYLEGIERIQRETPNAAQADKLVTAFAVPPEATQVSDAHAAAKADPRPALAASIRALKGLYRLSPLFTKDSEKKILVRFAKEALQDFIALLPVFVQLPPWPRIAAAAKDELAWLATPLPAPSPPAAPPPVFDPQRLQPGIVGADIAATHGCLVLLRVDESDAALKWLKTSVVGRNGKPIADGIRRNVGFSYAGLRALGIPAERLDPLPQEFMDGMESRAGLLGDVRGNHPDYWPRPERCNEKLEVDKGDRVDLTTVHLVLVMRLADTTNTSPDLHPRLAAEVAKLAPHTTGLQVVAVQPTRSNRVGSVTREHFGFIDGISQPGVKDIEPKPLPRDEIPPGDLCLGYDNSRDVVPPDPDPVDPLLVDGSFLVVRKLRQHVDRLTAVVDNYIAQTGLAGDAAVAKRTELLAKMMGRSQEGEPLASPTNGPTGNDFDFTGDTDGSKCPFHAHIRRAHPRDGRPHMPRLLRRGMSYGPRGGDAATERGIVFMAYCASIAEQFEIIQRWIAGGNSTGVSSAQADPFLAVPQPGEKRTFRYLDGDGNVARVDLGELPFATLEWGMYAFMPSLKVLSTLKSFRKLPPRPKAPPKPRELPDPLQPWRRLLEDSDPVRSPAPATWVKVRGKPGGKMLAPAYGTLVGRHADVLAVMQDTGAKYSVQGYGKRMSASIGLNHLGMDGAEHDRLALSINQNIADIDEEKAFLAAGPMVMMAVYASMALQQTNPDGSIRMPVDLIALAEKVLAGLCTEWVGLPEADAAKLPPGESPFMVVGGRVDGDPMPPRCPGNLLTASHYTFTPHLKPDVAVAGRTQGGAALKAVEQLLASTRPLGSLAEKIQADLKGIGATQEEIAHSISGVLLGFPPTVYGNFLRTLETWISEKTLWDCQRQLGDASAPDAYQRAVQALRPQLMATMRKRPVPEMLWRCPVEGGKAIGAEEGVDDDRRIVLGIASALTDPAAPDEMMFGGSRIPGSAVKTVHACPGYGMGVGVLLALIAGLLEAGTLRPTGSPVLLMLTPRADWLARAAALLQQHANA